MVAIVVSGVLDNLCGLVRIVDDSEVVRVFETLKPTGRYSGRYCVSPPPIALNPPPACLQAAFARRAGSRKNLL